MRQGNGVLFQTRRGVQAGAPGRAERGVWGGLTAGARHVQMSCGRSSWWAEDQGDLCGWKGSQKEGEMEHLAELTFNQ